MKISLFTTLALFCPLNLILTLSPGCGHAAPAIPHGGPLLSFDFNADTWPKAAASGVSARVARDQTGTIDSYKGKPSGALSLTADFSRAEQNAKASLSSGPLAVKNAETNLAKLTLGFDVWLSDLRPVRVVVQSLNAAGTVTGSRVATVLPPVKEAWYRFSLDLDKTQPLSGTFDPTAPQMQLVWELNDADGQVKRAANQVVRVDNVSVSAPSFYVSAKGSDAANGRTEATAFATIQKAVDAAQAGDVICVMDGTYVSRPGSDLAAIRKAGAPHAWIVLRNYPGHNPVLNSDGWNVVAMNHQSAYIEVRGLTVRGNRSRLTIEDALADSQKTPPSALYNTNGIALDSRQGTEQGGKAHHIRIIGNTVGEVPGGGISAIAGDYITIEGNHVFDNAHLMRYAGSGISVFRAWDFDTEKGYKNFVIGNRAHGNRCFVPWTHIGKISDGNGIIIDDFINYQSGASKIPYEGRTIVQNNLSYGNGGSGIHAYASNHVDIVNNTAYLNAQSPELVWKQIFAGGRCDDVRIFNNVMYAPQGKPLDVSIPKNSTNIVYANNLLFGEGDNNVQSGGGLGADAGTATGGMGSNVLADPKFARPSLDPKVADFRLASDSPGLNAARADHPGAPLQDLLGARRPQGAAPDLGAYEMPVDNQLVAQAPVRVVVPKRTGNLIDNGDFKLQTVGWDMNSFGKQPLQTEVVAGPTPGSKALRVTVAAEAEMKKWSVSGFRMLARGVEANEKLTLRFMARSPQGNTLATMIQQPAAPHRSAFYKEVKLTPQWAAYEVSGSNAQAFARGDVGLNIFFSLAPGVIEIADVQVLGAE